MTELELHWLAGLLEGEGCFTVYKPEKNNYPVCAIQIAMTDKDVMDRVHKLIGGHYSPYQATCKGKPTKTAYKIHLTNRREIAKLGAKLLPLMGERRAEALEKVIWTAENDHVKARWQ